MTTSDTERLVVLVGQMRHFQKLYFATKSIAVLDQAKSLESQVDKLLKKINGNEQKLLPF